MKRQVHPTEWLLLGLQVLVFLFLLTHDWVPLGTLNDIEAVKSQNTTGELVLTTIINLIPSSIALALTILSIRRGYHWFSQAYIPINYTFVLSGAISAWWIPYFFGATPDKVERFQIMFGQTHSFLPIKNGMIINSIHVLFHSSLILIILLSLYITIAQYQKRKANELSHSQ